VVLIPAKFLQIDSPRKNIWVQGTEFSARLHFELCFVFTDVYKKYEEDRRFRSWMGFYETNLHLVADTSRDFSFLCISISVLTPHTRAHTHKNTHTHTHRCACVVSDIGSIRTGILQHGVS